MKPLLACPLKPHRTRYCAENAFWMATLSKAVYTSVAGGTAPDEARILSDLQALDSAFDSVYGFDAQSSQGCIVVHQSYVAVVFRGTDEMADWLDNINVQMVAGPFGEVHAGFKNALMDIWPAMRQQLKTVQRSPKARPLWITGHSLGGAMATLAAAQLVQDDEPFFGVYTFGSPRCGDRDFARTYKLEAGERTYRFQNNNDLVSRIPARAMGYRHVGRIMYISHEGEIFDDVGFWYKFLDSVVAVLKDIGDQGLDAIKDHRMKRYVRALKRWGRRDPLAG